MDFFYIIVFSFCTKFLITFLVLQACTLHLLSVLVSFSITLNNIFLCNLQLVSFWIERKKLWDFQILSFSARRKLTKCTSPCIKIWGLTQCMLLILLYSLTILACQWLWIVYRCLNYKVFGINLLWCKCDHNDICLVMTVVCVSAKKFVILDYDDYHLLEDDDYNEKYVLYL